VVIWLYQHWSSIRSLALFIALTALCMLAFFAIGVIAMLIPYAAEIYPVNLRGTGSGLVAASAVGSRRGGMGWRRFKECFCPVGKGLGLFSD
jgi:putative MFS transporter